MGKPIPQDGSFGRGEKPSFHRVYDKEGLGYITTDTLRGLISELLAPLTDEELEGILEVT